MGYDLPQWFQWTSLAIFVVALVHTFSTKIFERLAHRHPNHAGTYHLLGEIEVVFGFWAMVLMVVMFLGLGKETAVSYMDNRSYIEPLFVFAIMVIAGTRPVIRVSMLAVQSLSRMLPLPASLSFYFVTLLFVPILGSFITEPAAMTVAALILRDRFYSTDISNKLKYATLGVLFVNISIGGTLTAYAAPPVLMVAKTWQWDTVFMATHIGWKAVVACIINTLAITWWFRKEITKVPAIEAGFEDDKLPAGIVLVHLAFLAAVVVFAHHPPVFMGLFLFFLGVATAYKRYQTRLILREGLLVAFFLAGLVVLGGLQQWWLSPLLQKMSPQTVFYGAAALTAITDNAALTYLGSLVEGLSDEFKYALVTGAVTGGGLTVIANAPNPAGFSILRKEFSDNVINPLGLLKSALLPTLTAILCFQLLPHL